MNDDHVIYLMARHNHGKDVPEHDLESLANAIKAHGFVDVRIQRTDGRRFMLELIERL